MESVASSASGLAVTYATEVGPVTVTLTVGKHSDGQDSVTCASYLGPQPAGEPIRRWTIVGLPPSSYREVG